MKNYRIVGALKHDGSSIDECLVANSASEAEAIAQRMGVLVSRVEFMEPSAPARSSYRKVRPRTDRKIVRCICTANAVIFLIPGMIVFTIALFMATLAFVDGIESGESAMGAISASISVITGAVSGIMLMLGGALLYMLLFIEQWLWDSRAYLARLG